MRRHTEQVGDALWFVKSASSPDEAARLGYEAAQLRRAAHPGVVEIGLGEAGVGEAGVGEIGKPGTVATVEGGGLAELRTRHAGRSLLATGAIPAPALCGLGAAVATVLADLHDLGVVHGAVDADHILIGVDGRPVLCGFGSSGSTDDQDPATDVHDLAETLAQGVEPDAPRRLVRLLRSAAPGGRVTSARAFAGLLLRADPDPQLPTPTAPPPEADPAHLAPSVPAPAALWASNPEGRATAGRATAGRAGVGGPPGGAPTTVGSPLAATLRVGARMGAAAPGMATPDERCLHRHFRMARSGTGRVSWRGPGRRLGVVAGGAVIVLVIVIVAVLATSTRHHPVAAPPVAVGPVPCPRTDRGCVPIVLHDGTFAAPSGTFAVGLRDAVVVLGRWTCGPGSLPAALDPRTGQVWAWLSWALPTDAVKAVAVAARPGARNLRVLPGTSGCDRLQVIGADGRVAVVAPGMGQRA